MRGKAFLCLLVVALLMTPVQAGDVSAMQQQPAEDPKQPNANNTTMYIWANGMSSYWTHFNNNDTESVAENELMEEKGSGVITIKYRFTMDPSLDKRLQMTEGGEMRANFQVYFEGDQTNGDNNGPCQSDCDFLNITVFRGANEVYQHTEQPWPAGNWKNIVFSHSLTEEGGNLLWDGTNDNPIIEVTMKVKGDEGPGVFPGTTSGTPAAFGIKLGEEARLELPVDPSTWEEAFQAGEDGMADSEDTPGFTLVVASAAIGMAMFINASKDEEPEA
ncbi:hypothetical protein OAG22_00475 [Candidatus Poseidoniaceae archaeon]|nr:hypothetical protein [Candidatus Poseidoniales archaeon]MDB4758128.1 hypothetical protein [Candidatus Poseidoniaceae archaeon]